jgi:hypothetical protein
MKSHVSDLQELAFCILKDASAKCAVDELNLERDIKTIISRVKHEGLSFLTITLPSFGKDFDRSLDHGSIDSTFFRSFKKKGRFPAFLQGYLSQVFDKSNGRIHNEPDMASIECVRQITYTFKKLKEDCKSFRTFKALSDFITSEQIFERELDPLDIDDFINISGVIWGGAFDEVNTLSTISHHGPGATAERISGNQKYRFHRWHDRLEPYFPLLHHAFSSETAYGSKEFEDVSIISEEQEQPVRVITVPKTLKGPRIIAIEPVCMQYTQQGIKDVLYDILEKLPITRGHVNFTDQNVNRNLALDSSRTGAYATLDLSSASDRVPNSLIKHMFVSNPLLHDAMQACRSRKAQLPSGKIISLSKFAAMGSALCFPVEAMYFYTICVIALLRKYDLPFTYLNAYKVSRHVYIYGDDIIVPTDAADVVSSTLHKYYCKVSKPKSFWTGKFRESCGMDAYDGEDVTPVYVRHHKPTNKRTSAAVLSWVATSNLFYKKGFWVTSQHMLNACERIIGPIPITSEDCAGVGKVSFQRVVSIDRWGRNLQRPEVRTMVASPIYTKKRIEGYSALVASLIDLERRVNPAETVDDKLTKYAQHGAVT